MYQRNSRKIRSNYTGQGLPERHRSTAYISLYIITMIRSAVVTVVACRTAMRRVQGSSLMPGCPLLGSPSLNGYWSMTGKPNTAEKGTGHPTSLSRWPSIMGVAMCQSATLKLACHLGLVFLVLRACSMDLPSFEKERSMSPQL